MGTSLRKRFERLGELKDVEQAVEYGYLEVSLMTPGHPELPSRLANLAASHSYRFQRLGELGDLEKAIKCGGYAATLAPYDHPHLPGLLTNLGVSHKNRFKRLGDLDDLEKAIEYQSDAVDLTPKGHPSLPSYLANLATSYTHRFQRLDKLADLEKAIKYGANAVTFTPHGHSHLPGLLANLGICHENRFERLGELDDLKKAIECQSHAITLTPYGHPDLPRILASLSVTHRNRFKRLGDLGDLEKAIECGSHAVLLTPKGHPDLSSRLASLGASHNHRFERLGELSDLERAIECGSYAVTLNPRGHPQLPSRLANLGASHRNRFKRLGELSDIEKAIECESCAVNLTPVDHPDLPNRLASLGASHSYRYGRIGELIDLEKAIECGSRAINLTPDAHPNLAYLLAYLGASHKNRFDHLGELGDLDKSIEYQTRAVRLTPNGHPNLSGQLAGLGASYSRRFECLGKLSDIEKAIECESHAVALTPYGHHDLLGRLANLGASHSHRYKHLGELSDLYDATEYQHRVVILTPKGHAHLPRRLANLATSHGHRFQRLGDPSDLERAIEYQYQAVTLTAHGHPDLTWQHFNLATCYFYLSLYSGHPSHQQGSFYFFCLSTQSVSGAPRLKFDNALRWAQLASRNSFLRPLEAYQTAIDLLPQFVWLGATTTQRYEDLETVEALAVQAASTAIASSDYTLALEWLEHARCVVWNQSLMLRSPLDELRSANLSLATRLQEVADDLHSASLESRESRARESGSMTPEQVAQEHRALAEEYKDLLAQVREMPGFEDFLQPIKANDLICAARYGPVVVINCHEDRCDALVILPGQNNINHIPLSNFTKDKAQRTRFEMGHLLRSNRIREGGIERRPMLPAQEVDFESLLAVLWYNVVKPVLDYLGYTSNVSTAALPHITWCPTGAISFLPLHAAGDYNQPSSRVFDYVVSSYTPTLTALLASTPSLLTLNPQVLAIGQPNTPGHTELPGTTKELAYVKAHTEGKVEYSQLVESQATKMKVLDAMEKHDWVHFACHAHQNVQDPTMSGFFLHDDTLDLASINRRLFKNKGLAFLSACQTATGDEKLPDEAIHLSSGMLMAGYSSVIGTMWSVVDEDAPFVADKVYGQLMKEKKLGNGKAGKALHSAIAALREQVGEKSFGRWVPYIHIGS
ncbi:unnamed protein product [Rhizoctonia solani]|uniref:CHAT domain-containing protein n=1 Tax=Rhizoctonia solani TaxID=456999 RepID=A0A8H3BTG2_9AGAM|nr:unnamed protein product [Rhizoctonia solani]